MTNRLALSLAVTAGYVLGRTKKAKWVIGIGGMVLGKRLNLSPQQLLATLTKQLQDNPQFAQLREQVNGDLKGVGKAATSALVTRQVNSLADSLHDRTLGVQDRIGVPAGGGAQDDTEPDRDAAADAEAESGTAPGAEDAPRDEAADGERPRDEGDGEDGPARKTRRPAAGSERPARRKAAAKKPASAAKSAEKAPAKSRKAASSATRAARSTGGDRRG
ncbi:DNA primase [Streptomyces sp. TRM 70351]|uniref:DNA primase n=1 Tax=Streptomyces sp. TRM 70351 TaxID=3116552 RepID=UPI002E7AFB7D|nr:DNA primase [Streptomyces sp. TRM 70351]MEE1928263.1 DNA primase [Streptomyces sp. TRM 70351]